MLTLKRLGEVFIEEPQGRFVDRPGEDQGGGEWKRRARSDAQAAIAQLELQAALFSGMQSLLEEE